MPRDPTLAEGAAAHVLFRKWLMRGQDNEFLTMMDFLTLATIAGAVGYWILGDNEETREAERRLEEKCKTEQRAAAEGRRRGRKGVRKIFN